MSRCQTGAGALSWASIAATFKPKRVRMPKLPIDDEVFAADFEALGAAAMSRKYGIDVRHVYSRRVDCEQRTGRKLLSPTPRGSVSDRVDPVRVEHATAEADVRDGVVLVGSDGHYWPGVESTAHRAFVLFAKELKPKLVVFNGDALDAASISRHPPIGWEKAPTLAEELECVQTRLGEIQQAAGKRCRFIWTLGNHDARFNTRLASMTPQYKDVPGTRLVEHFPEWEPAWSVEVGGPAGAIIKHRFKGGVHATHNNALYSGRTMVTGHLHSQKITPFTDMNGTRWGVDTGCLAHPWGPQFEYQEQNPRNHRSGFAVLTWEDDELMPPELVTVVDEARGIIVWRGKRMEV